MQFWKMSLRTAIQIHLLYLRAMIFHIRLRCLSIIAIYSTSSHIWWWSSENRTMQWFYSLLWWWELVSFRTVKHSRLLCGLVVLIYLTTQNPTSAWLVKVYQQNKLSSKFSVFWDWVLRRLSAAAAPIVLQLTCFAETQPIGVRQ